MSDASTYDIDVPREGSGGWLFYVERGARLPFNWASVKAEIKRVSLPPPAEWDAYCEHHGAPWAKGRGAEIVQRLAASLPEKWYGGGSHQLSEDGGLYVYPAPSRLSKVLDWVFGGL